MKKVGNINRIKFKVGGKGIKKGVSIFLIFFNFMLFKSTDTEKEGESKREKGLHLLVNSPNGCNS